MNEHTPRSYGDMVMNEYLKGLAEIAKQHPSTIEKLEALERAATEKYGVTEWSEEHLYEINGAVMNALGPLLAVANAAKCYTNADPMVRGEAYRDLCEALAQLEATP